MQIENVDSYIYLGRRYSTRDKNQDKDIQRRTTAGRTAFATHRDIFKGNIGTCLKRQIYNSCVLPAMTYGTETWALTTHAKNKWAAWIMLNITYLEIKTDICVPEMERVQYKYTWVRVRLLWTCMSTSTSTSTSTQKTNVLEYEYDYFTMYMSTSTIT